MKIAVYTQNTSLREDPRFRKMLSSLSSHDIALAGPMGPIERGSEMILAVGGDGTFLSAARLSFGSGIPVLGVNMGRMGFLSEAGPEDVVSALDSGKFTVEDRNVLSCSVDGHHLGYSLNEVAVNHLGATMLGVDVRMDGESLPTFWSDGLVVSTSAGSTAYALSVGGPICMPEAGVLIIAPIAPHNLNVRPLVVPSSTSIELTFRSREPQLRLSCDNVSSMIEESSTVSISLAQFSLKRVRLASTDFIVALKTKLFWGEDVRNGNS